MNTVQLYTFTTGEIKSQLLAFQNVFDSITVLNPKLPVKKKQA